MANNDDQARRTSFQEGAAGRMAPIPGAGNWAAYQAGKATRPSPTKVVTPFPRQHSNPQSAQSKSRTALNLICAILGALALGFIVNSTSPRQVWPWIVGFLAGGLVPTVLVGLGNFTAAAFRLFFAMLKVALVLGLIGLAAYSLMHLVGH
jgi:hypothetical protein